MPDDFAAAAHIFGYVASELHFFQTVGALGVFLVTLYQVRRWWDV